MSRFKLQQYDMEELKPTEIKKIEGGILFPPIGLGAIVYQIEGLKSFMEGYNDATN